MSETKMNIAIVTGTSSGIGEATARELLGRGWQVVGIARRPGNIEEPGYSHLSLDLAEVGSIAKHLDAELKQPLADSNLKRLALVNSAASPGLLGTIAQTDPEEMLKVYAINVVAPACFMGWMARQSASNARRVVVNVSSGVTEGAFPGMSTYAGTKVALLMTGMVLAAEIDAIAPQAEMCVHSYDPGPVDTPMQTTVRNSSVETLPIVAAFEQFKENGMLSKAEDYALAIADFLEGNETARFTQERYSAVPKK